jgi:hypothetical protein
MKLHEIADKYQSVFDEINETGEINEIEMDILDNLDDDFEKKAISIATHIKNIEAEEDAIANAIAEMVIRKNRLAKQVESWSSYLQFNLEKLSINEIKSSPLFNIKLKSCPLSVNVLDESAIPSKYWREKLVKSVDKIQLKKELDVGVIVPGATLQRKIKLEIK